MKLNFSHRAVCAAAATSIALLASTHLALAQSSEDPFAKTVSVANDWAQQLTTVVYAGAGLAGVIVIALAIFGRLAIGWAVRIILGLIALGGLNFLIDSIKGG